MCTRSTSRSAFRTGHPLLSSPAEAGASVTSGLAPRRPAGSSGIGMLVRTSIPNARPYRACVSSVPVTGGGPLERAAVGPRQLDQPALEEVEAQIGQVALDLLDGALVEPREPRCDLVDRRAGLELAQHPARRRVEPVIAARLQVQDDGLVGERAVDDVLWHTGRRTEQVQALLPSPSRHQYSRTVPCRWA